MKKNYLLFTAFLFFVSQNIFAQIDTSGGRYYQELFTNVTVTSNIAYGSNVKYNGQTQTLLMDIYEPTGDTVQLRPLIVLAHGGSFIGGTKTDGDVTTLCTRFAKMGYVTASIEYRIGMFPIDSVNAIKAVLRATQDMKAAVRWFRQDAAGANTYGIHTNYIFIGGSSAGAFMALHHAYMDKVSEFPLGATTLSSMGGLEGTSGNPGWSTSALAVINLCGALGDSSYLEAGDIPLVSMHGTNDGIVPYGSAIITIVIFQIMEVDGSASIKARADNLGILNPFYTFIGADHVPYAGGGAVPAAYMDTTVWFIRDFLRPFLGIPAPTTVDDNNLDNAFGVFPNPSEGVFHIVIENFKINLTGLITDLSGRTIDRFTIGQANYSYSSSLAKGIYLLKISGENNYSVVKKIVVE
ncbi:MAG: T9SS type A sorting domain-containing protein [Bacteroidia bacterium]